MNTEILIVDDEPDIRNLIKGILEDEGYAIRVASNASEALKEVNAKKPDLVILDIWLQNSEKDGLELLQDFKEKMPGLPAIMISGHGTIETAVSSIKKGAYDFIEKPFKSDRLILMAKRAIEAAALRRENEQLKQKTREEDILVGNSAPIEQARRIIEKVATSNSRVLITGEAGTGKDIAARNIYKLSKRSHKPFIILNCATLEPDQFEIKLFGTAGGAESSDAKEKEHSLLEQAHQGTLFLDEISDMPLETQGKIVRVLQEHRIRKKESQSYVDVDIRIIASSNKDLEEEIKAGHFREDLFYRLNVVPIHMPPLRDCTEDIPLLVNHLYKVINGARKDTNIEIYSEALAAMKSYDWPGNVRQLRNMVEWTFIMKGGKNSKYIEMNDLPPEIRLQGRGHAEDALENSNQKPSGLDYIHMPLRDAREEFERAYLLSQIKRFDGNVSKTAEFIGMERSALHRKLKSLDVPTSFQSSTKQRKRA